MRVIIFKDANQRQFNEETKEEKTVFIFVTSKSHKLLWKH